ncbi:MAG TPA: hypothetical protein PK177_17705, partial [Burkholderiaceae bacterium]|nr:hypothetical protein [Burkholderiaceae bacterium]
MDALLDAAKQAGLQLATADQDRAHARRQHLGSRGDTERFAESSQRARGLLEASVEQQIGHAGLRLHLIGQRRVGRRNRADVDDQVGTERQDALELGRRSATGQPPEFRQIGHFGQQQGCLVGAQRARPA